jgi:para-nitrobenzyl esterase
MAPALLAVVVAAPLVASPAYAGPGGDGIGSVAVSNQGNEANGPVKKVTGGVVRGSVGDDGVTVFQGIPYAASTAGENRWRAPQPVEKWTGIKDTAEYGPITVQTPAAGLALGPWTTEYLDTGMTLENGLMSEDSLSLNVWTAAKPNAGRPVIVYIHGGGNQSGSGGNEVYTGEEIAQKDVVYVSINYRVGIFGFLAYKDVTGEEVTGNFAFMDMIASLQWVRDNIRAFGGDPANVTVAGQSAGSGNIQTLISSPAAAGLFDRAVTMSGNSINRPVATLAQAQGRATQAFGEYTLDDLRAMSSAEVQALTARYNPTGAVIDGTIITQSITDAYLSGTANPVDLMIGNVDGDAGLFGPLRLPDDNSDPFDLIQSVSPAVYAAAVTAQLGPEFLELYPVDPAATNVIETARELNADGMVAGAARHAEVRELNYSDQNSYLYQFSHIVPDTAPRMEAYGAFHTGDVGYWLNYFSDTWHRPWTDVDYSLGDAMSSFLVDFATDGTVEGWPAYDASKNVVEYLHFEDAAEVDTLDAAKAAAWEGYWIP